MSETGPSAGVAVATKEAATKNVEGSKADRSDATTQEDQQAKGLMKRAREAVSSRLKLFRSSGNAEAGLRDIADKRAAQNAILDNKDLSQQQRDKQLRATLEPTSAQAIPEPSGNSASEYAKWLQTQPGEYAADGKTINSEPNDEKKLGRLKIAAKKATDTMYRYTRHPIKTVRANREAAETPLGQTDQQSSEQNGERSGFFDKTRQKLSEARDTRQVKREEEDKITKALNSGQITDSEYLRQMRELNARSKASKDDQSESAETTQANSTTDKSDTTSKDPSAEAIVNEPTNSEVLKKLGIDLESDTGKIVLAKMDADAESAKTILEQVAKAQDIQTQTKEAFDKAGIPFDAKKGFEFALGQIATKYKEELDAASTDDESSDTAEKRGRVWEILLALLKALGITLAAGSAVAGGAAVNTVGIAENAAK